MIDIRQLGTFDQVAANALIEPIFGNEARQQYLRELIGVEADDREKALRDALPKAVRIRMGAFDGERFVGCSSGWFESDGSFHIGLSVVDPAYRRQGVYTRLLKAVEAAVRERGSLRISSHHVATNNPVLIAKLRLGYVIVGTEYSEQMGLLVRLVLHLSLERHSLFASRTGTLVPPDRGTSA